MSKDTVKKLENKCNTDIAILALNSQAAQPTARSKPHRTKAALLLPYSLRIWNYEDKFGNLFALDPSSPFPLQQLLIPD